MSIVGDASDVRNYFDHDNILSKWGFADNICHYCGVKNSDLNGLLMQCGKCKKGKKNSKDRRYEVPRSRRHLLFLFNSQPIIVA